MRGNESHNLGRPDHESLTHELGPWQRGKLTTGSKGGLGGRVGEINSAGRCPNGHHELRLDLHLCRRPWGGKIRATSSAAGQGDVHLLLPSQLALCQIDPRIIWKNGQSSILTHDPSGCCRWCLCSANQSLSSPGPPGDSFFKLMMLKVLLS